MKEAKQGEFSLVYNETDRAFAVALTKEQHEILQAFLCGIGEISVISKIEVNYKRIE